MSNSVPLQSNLQGLPVLGRHCSAPVRQRETASKRNTAKLIIFMNWTHPGAATPFTCCKIIIVTIIIYASKNYCSTTSFSCFLNVRCWTWFGSFSSCCFKRIGHANVAIWLSNALSSYKEVLCLKKCHRYHSRL